MREWALGERASQVAPPSWVALTEGIGLPRLTDCCLLLRQKDKKRKDKRDKKDKKKKKEKKKVMMAFREAESRPAGSRTHACGAHYGKPCS